MKQIQHAVISLCVMIYISFLLFIFGINTTNSFKYLFMLMGALIISVSYFFVIKKVNWNIIKKEITEEKKEILRNKMKRIKKIVSFFVYTFMIICIFLGLSNDGEFHVKYIFPFFKKRFSDNEIFNWIIILSPLCYIASIYNFYISILQIIIEKYDLNDKAEVFEN